MFGKFFHNEKKIWLLVKAAALLIVLSAVILVLFNYFNYSLSIKITLTLITVLLAIIDIYNNYQNSDKPIFEKKRTWMIFLAICWFLFTVWDNINQQNQELKQAKRADSLSTVVAKRTDKIISDISLSLQELEKSGEGIGNIDSLLLKVKDTLEYQVDLLKIAVGKSKEITELENKKLKLQSPEVTVLSGKIEFIDLPKDTTRLGVKLNFINYKQRIAKNLKYTSCLIVYNRDYSRKNIFLAKPEIWSDTRDLNGNGSTEYNSEMYFGIQKEEFKKDYGMAILVIRMKYRDEYDSSEREVNKFFACRYAAYGNLGFSDANQKEEKFAVTYLKELKLSDFLVKQ